MLEHKYVYILLRKDLSNSQRVVQSCHVAWEISKLHDLKEHPSMVVMGIENECKLKNEADRMARSGFQVIKFYEPLFENKLSSIAVLAKTEGDRDFFKRYNLLTNESFLSKADQEKIKIQNCNHSKTKLAYRESMGFEFHPSKICSKCHKVIVSELTDLEKLNLLKEFYNDIKMELTQEEINNKKDGFSL